MNNISSCLRRCLFLVLLALMVTSDSTAQRFEPRIVFASNHDGNWDGNWDIYSMNVDGDNLLQLTDHPGPDDHPSGSPDGRRITFRSRRGLTSDLYVMDSDGNNVIGLTHDSFFEIRASWSPDGHKIAFGSYRDGGFNDPEHIFVMNADGEGRRNLTADTGLTSNRFPTWSSDGSKIAFHSERNSMGSDIYVITAEGKNLERLTEEGDNRLPAYSPDGAKIAFASTRDGDTNIYLMDTNGRNAVKLTRTPPGVDNVFPSWLPLGAFIVNPNGKLPISWGKIRFTRNPC